MLNAMPWMPGEKNASDAPAFPRCPALFLPPSQPSHKRFLPLSFELAYTVTKGRDGSARRAQKRETTAGATTSRWNTPRPRKTGDQAKGRETGASGVGTLAEPRWQSRSVAKFGVAKSGVAKFGGARSSWDGLENAPRRKKEEKKKTACFWSRVAGGWAGGGGGGEGAAKVWRSEAGSRGKGRVPWRSPRCLARWLFLERETAVSSFEDLVRLFARCKEAL